MRIRIRPHGFTLLELLVVILIIGVLAGLLLPALGGARRTSKELKNTTQVKNIQAAMVQYSDRNGGWYPGFNADGLAVSDTYRMTDPDYAYDTRQETTAALVYWQILKEGLLAPDGLVSPLETEAITPYGQGRTDAFKDDMFSTEFASRRSRKGPEHYSFAVLDPNVEDGDGTERKRNWRNNNNSQAVIASDRATAMGDVDGKVGFTSIHSFQPFKWRGSMAWNDGRAGFQESPVVSTRYTQDTPSNADNIFYGHFLNVKDNDKPSHDALMMWHYEPGRDVWSSLREEPYVSP